jgi:hypothetical protein
VEALREPYGFLGAWYRHIRAGEHLAEVHRLCDAFKATPQDVGSHIEPQTVEELVSLPNNMRRVPVPHDIPLRIGETAYNLRCALDYLVFALAWHDTGREPTEQWAKRLQFPIEHDLERFKRRRTTMLEGVSDEHAALIESYQPGAGCDWTAVLAGLNDADKHRHLIVLAGSFDSESGTWTHTARPHPDAVPNERGLYSIDEMEMHVEATIDVAFPDGRLVTETLQELQTQVRKLLIRFAAEFTLLPLD